jgi:hypothetical protein
LHPAHPDGAEEPGKSGTGLLLRFGKNGRANSAFSMNLLETWSTWRPRQRGFRVLPADKPVLESLADWRKPVRWRSWEQCQAGYDPWADKTPLHLGLCPLPFIGDVRNAKVCFLLLNPGLAELDYFAEYKVPQFASRLRANLRQDFSGTEYPFFPLDPQFAWHSGNRYWQTKLGPVINKLAKPSQHAHVRKVVAQNVCAIELVPYHSVSNSLTGSMREKLASTQLAKAYVRDVLLEDARRGKRLLVAMRSTADWGIMKNSRGVRCFQGGEARGARLSTADRSSHGSKVAEVLRPLL